MWKEHRVGRKQIMDRAMRHDRGEINWHNNEVFV